MTSRYHDIAFTPSVVSVQAAMGSRDIYSGNSVYGSGRQRLTQREIDFIQQRDSFYLGSVSETGWPYIQHRGGPRGFLKVIGRDTLGFADYSGNRQYISTGNFTHSNKASLFLMDYSRRRRLKLFGRAEIIGTMNSFRLADPDYPAKVERGILIHIEGFDWNCPQHIPRSSPSSGLKRPRPDLQRDSAQPTSRIDIECCSDSIGDGPLPLIISGIRQLTSRIRAYELRNAKGGDLPTFEPGAHLIVPLLLPNGTITNRRYSIASSPLRRDAYEIAVLRQPFKESGSSILHQSYQIGLQLNTELSQNDFKLHSDSRPALLIAGGIGITSIKPMALALLERSVDFELHYAGRSRSEMAYLRHLQCQLPERLITYSSEDGSRIDVYSVLSGIRDDTIIYGCGPEELMNELKCAAFSLGFPQNNLHFDIFT